MIKRISVFFIAISAVVACATNPVTGRSQFKLLPEAELQSMASTEYQQFLAQNRTVSPSADRDAEMVRRVGQRLATAVTSYYRSQNLGEAVAGYQWEFNLVNDKAANAWVMPGGKCVVYTGLLPITQNEAALANVIGHEISHAIFQHGNERMSQQMAAQGLGTGLSIAMANKPAVTQQIFSAAFGLGAQAGILLPFSRKHELEADRYGMRWAAMAGYNPREAIALWQRMEQASGGQAPPEFMSTHPSTGTRINELQRYLDEALKYYKPAGGR